MGNQFAQHLNRIALKHQDIAPNDRIEWTVEGHFGGVTNLEGHIGQRRRTDPRICGFNGHRDSIHTQNLTRIVNQSSNE